MFVEVRAAESKPVFLSPIKVAQKSMVEHSAGLAWGKGSSFGAISDADFAQFQALLYKLTGIALTPGKKALVVSRLSSRLRASSYDSFTSYYRYVSSPVGAHEQQIMVDLLTTNETRFFREPKHFEFLAQRAVKEFSGTRPFRVWSAASSTGEEAYSIAMVLAESMGSRPWEIVGTDVSKRVLEQAQRGQYRVERAEHIPVPLLAKYWRPGGAAEENTIRATSQLRERVKFVHLNLLGDWSSLGQFDVIFLRNVMIYFDTETKRELVRRICAYLTPGGYLFVGHSETIHGLDACLKTVVPAVFQCK